ncbi:gamma-glutamylcyclotransferase [Jannaschia aquimarina]|uniref:glutathione-specific gamma-glutamylcyclotransferase n=1 Tax=Jannaschia aquimarina TaxID=935700 RepID=A0A0D1CRK2_9RHOB|nr:gamma-glutamylcyclotransferase [Jannaschia aquimarina]KIT17402.1 ChaC-like protein [Jannaschia aquimarina]SNT24418.1 cation transport protein ChaC [Jannaschia aquimarina]
MTELWVFGYGSLIWNAGFDVAETRPARLTGYRRRFCMWSIHHRGTEAEPGLVLALEPAADVVCEGLALRAADPEPALAGLRERELVSSAYHERQLRLATPDGDVQAVAYVVDTTHRQYAADLSLEEQARIIARAHGGRGPNTEYLHNTADALASHDIHDPDIDRLTRLVRDAR